VKRKQWVVVVGVAFSAVAGLALEDAKPAYAAGSCAVSALVCANDSSPGCETICGGGQQAICTEGTCSPGGNIVTPNRCECR